MTAEEIFCDFRDKYGEDFIWFSLPYTETFFVAELKRELGTNYLFADTVYSVAKCEANDDVLFLCGSSGTDDIYRIYHLTYNPDSKSLPRYVELIGTQSVKEYIEKQFIENYL